MKSGVVWRGKESYGEGGEEKGGEGRERGGPVIGLDIGSGYKKEEEGVVYWVR